MSSPLQEPRGRLHSLSSVAQSQTPENVGGSRGPSTIESDMSHYLHFEDNGCFFAPTELGQKPPRQAEGQEPRHSLIDAEQPRAPED
ncbi:hypothetical protein BDV26DRAFT_265479 [Aspergillus bertholletiae]|uniref:Uncharacterized protein n=1 Tax=Aspergillus bertholletiae TaxID=1226010 RepID=A0A5N7B5Q4_9EURO|nr:hypothetical protein BDV26DRAFT_265479 [Aspergillus bertholletiae]